MKTIQNPVEWFSDNPLPDFMQTPAVVLGGRRLLREFLRQSALINLSGKMSIAVANASAEGLRLAQEWTQFNHRNIDIQIKTESEVSVDNIRNELGRFPWRSLDVSPVKTLHAKVYSYLAENGSSVCLVGSHNFSLAAMQRNGEFGILLIGHGRTWITNMAHVYGQYVLHQTSNQPKTYLTESK